MNGLKLEWRRFVYLAMGILIINNLISEIANEQSLLLVDVVSVCLRVNCVKTDQNHKFLCSY